MRLELGPKKILESISSQQQKSVEFGQKITNGIMNCPFYYSSFYASGRWQNKNVLFEIIPSNSNPNYPYVLR